MQMKSLFLYCFRVLFIVNTWYCFILSDEQWELIVYALLFSAFFSYRLKNAYLKLLNLNKSIKIPDIDVILRLRVIYYYQKPHLIKSFF